MRYPRTGRQCHQILQHKNHAGNGSPITSSSTPPSPSKTGGGGRIAALPLEVAPWSSGGGGSGSVVAVPTAVDPKEVASKVTSSGEAKTGLEVTS